MEFTTRLERNKTGSLKSPATARAAWFQLFRPPNLFTVPGDPVCGFLLAGGALIDWTWSFAVSASLLLYTAGLLLNDVLDLREDAVERPHRPIPSGMVQPVAVWVAASVLLLFGLGVASVGGILALKMGALLILAIAAYDGGLKRVPVLGAVTMGMCRAFSVLLGASFMGALTTPAITAAVLIGLYIAAVTELARHETKAFAPRYARVLPVLVMALGVVLVRRDVASLILLVAAGMVAGGCAVRLFRQQETPIPPMIGLLIRNLLLIQAAFCVAARSVHSSAWWAAVVLIIFWPLGRLAAKRFYAS